MRKICFSLMLMACTFFASCTKETKIQFNKNASVANLFDVQNDVQNVEQDDGQNNLQNARQSNTTKNSYIIEENVQNNTNLAPLVDNLKSAPNDSAFVTVANTTDGIDIDLTKMSADFVYATLFQFMVDIESYKDFTVRMRGAYMLINNEHTNQAYSYCTVKDASACCIQGIEFKCTGQDVSSLKDGDEITVSGRFTLYAEEIDGVEETFYCLDNATVTKNF